MAAQPESLKKLRRLRVLACMQQKGGVGKTSITKLLGIYFASFRQARVLLMDFDPQCNLSNKFLRMEKKQGIPGWLPPLHPDYDPTDNDWNGHSSTAELFQTGVIFPYPTKYGNLDIVPGEGERLSLVEQNLPNEITQRVINRPREWLSLPEVQEEYDLVIIDTPPSRQALSRGALRGATHLIIPMLPEPNSEEGLSDMLEMWRTDNLKRSEDDPVEMVGILANLVRVYGKNVKALHGGILEALREDKAIGPHIIPHTLNDWTSIGESDYVDDADWEDKNSSRKTPFDLPAHSKDRRNILVVCRYIENKLFGDVTG